MKDKITGTVQVYTIDEQNHKTLLFEKHNQIQNDYAKILPILLSGDMSARINKMYFEFQNVSSPTDTVSPDENFSASLNASYYAELSGNTDFVRHDLVLTPIIKDGSITFHTVIGDGTAFHNSIEFGTENVNSRIYSMALVAGSSSDQTKDLIFARSNWSTQKVKTPMDQLYVVWTINFAQ